MRYHCLTTCFVAVTLMAVQPARAQMPPVPLEAMEVIAAAGTTEAAFDGVVESVRQAVVAAQVSGEVVELAVEAGDRVQAGQLLVRIDARAAEQSAAASAAQVQAARAALELAAKDFEREQRLFEKGFISQAALERAEAAFKSAAAQARALLAQADAARTQSGYYVVRAPFAGVVSEVPVSLGDMAMPGRTLLTMYDPGALRVTAAVPQSVAVRLGAGPGLRIELPSAREWVVPATVELLPSADPGTHTMQLRAMLPADLDGVVPGMFARLWLKLARGDDEGVVAGAGVVLVPQQAVVRRAELTGLYVLNPQGQPVLRQVRLGRRIGVQVEVLSGLGPGERVVTEPQAAARMR